MLSARNPINLKTPKPKMPPSKGWGRRKLFDEVREERLARPVQEDILSSQSQRHSGTPGPSSNDPPPSEERLVSQEDIFSESQSQSPTEDLGPRETFNGPPPSVPEVTPSLPAVNTAPLLPETPQGTQTSGRIISWLFTNETEVSDEEQGIERTETDMINPVAENVMDGLHEEVTSENTEAARLGVVITNTTVSPEILSVWDWDSRSSEH